MELAASHVQLGDVATWVGGIATAVALLLTWALLVITRREQKDLRAEHREAQARLVSAWSDHVEESAQGPVHSVTVTLQNLSDEPIYGPRVAVGIRWSAESVPYEELDFKYVIPPKSHERLPAPPAAGRGDGEQAPPPVELIFSDASHRFWHRDRNGRLIEIPKEQLPISAGKYFFQAANVN